LIPEKLSAKRDKAWLFIAEDILEAGMVPARLLNAAHLLAYRL
jgi:hypothetical protein